MSIKITEDGGHGGYISWLFAVHYLEVNLRIFNLIDILLLVKAPTSTINDLLADIFCLLDF